MQAIMNFTLIFLSPINQGLTWPRGADGRQQPAIRHIGGPAGQLNPDIDVLSTGGQLPHKEAIGEN